MKELQDSTFPGRVKEIEEICGQAIPYEVDWDSLADDAQALNFIDNISCHRLNMALRMICQDDLGKQAVREARAAIHWLAEHAAIDPRRIALGGYSLGAYLSVIVAADDQLVRAVALAAGGALDDHGNQGHAREPRDYS